MAAEISISLTEYEAVLSLEFVTRLNQTGTVQNKPEQRVLWNLEALLEKEIPSIFGKRYGEILEEARKNLQD